MNENGRVRAQVARWASSKLLAACAIAPLLAACGGTTPDPQVPANGTSGPAAPAGDPFAVTQPVREEMVPMLKPAVVPTKTALVAPPLGLPPAPPACGAFVARKGAAKCPAGDALTLLATAVEENDAAKRDQLLADLESCTAVPTGVARSLRAEFAPPECAEALAEPLLKTPGNMTPAVYNALLGQAVASRLARAATSPPKLPPPYDKQHVLDFQKGPMTNWIVAQAKITQEVSQTAAELPYYAQGVAAIEAGMADLRLVDAMREVPIPDEFAKDAELKNAYYASLDQALDPRKDRGRDAALVGLKQFALVGSISDARVGRARAMLSRLYGGKRIDALDALLVPPASGPAPASTEERLALALPTFYSSVLLDEKAASHPGTMRMFARKGVPLPQRTALKGAELPAEVRAAFARARLDMGRMYWRGVDFDQAAALAADLKDARPDDATFVLALAIALRTGPEDATDLMRHAPSVAQAGTVVKPNVRALDAVAGSSSPFASLAAFDAAMVLEIGAPQGADAAYWKDVASRYRAAAGKLTDAKAQKEADERAKSADAVAAAIH